MKKSIRLLVLTLFCLPIVSFAQTAMPRIMFEKLQHNFGTFSEESGVQSVFFNFKNEGKAPLILNNVQASCGCTTPEWTREPIAPGAKGSIKVSYDPKGRVSVFNKTIRVSSNAENSDVVLTILGEVTPRVRTIEEDYPNEIGVLRAKARQISFPTIKEHQIKKDSIEIVNNSAQAVQLSFQTPPPHLTATIKPAKLAPKQKGYIVVTFDANKIQAYGFVMYSVFLNVDGQNDYKNAITVSANMEEDFSNLTQEELNNAPVIKFNEESFDFGDIKQGASVEHTFTVRNEGKRDLIIRDVKTSCGCTAVVPPKKLVAAGENVPLKVVFNSTGKSGRQNKTITIITNDPKNPTSFVRISSNILTN